MQFSTSIVSLIAFWQLASAADICPPNYCTIGDACDYSPDSSHCCDGSTAGNVLQCVDNKWALRNTCDSGQVCYCTSSSDLICGTANKFKA